MMKSLRVPTDLLALSQKQRAGAREAGVPLYLPAFQSVVLDDPDARGDRIADADFGAEADAFTIADEDDDFC